ncbi:unnamed protein product [Ceratitis capitata]|uniref:(Mediterranean fruit fly) hypothetical protein n=1 Tax=Ceratitis capitata TaxID=7213 RepID=A0A811UN69_CERCA|nr:unnamed protein product [Ceratitis capitata]
MQICKRVKQKDTHPTANTTHLSEYFALETTPLAGAAVAHFVPGFILRPTRHISNLCENSKLQIIVCETLLQQLLNQ